jgi:hypothetical protein
VLDVVSGSVAGFSIGVAIGFDVSTFPRLEEYVTRTGLVM